jgi:hypothetical protein
VIDFEGSLLRARNDEIRADMAGMMRRPQGCCAKATRFVTPWQAGPSVAVSLARPTWQYRRDLKRTQAPLTC